MRRRWTKWLPFNSYECELWVMPWNLNANHWNVCVLELRNSRMVVYESMHMNAPVQKTLKQDLREIIDGAVRCASNLSPLRKCEFQEPQTWDFRVVYGNMQPSGLGAELDNQCALFAVAHCREVVVCTPALLPSNIAPSFGLCLTPSPPPPPLVRALQLHYGGEPAIARMDTNRLLCSDRKELIHVALTLPPLDVERHDATAAKETLAAPGLFRVVRELADQEVSVFPPVYSSQPTRCKRLPGGTSLLYRRRATCVCCAALTLGRLLHRAGHAR